MIFIISLVQFGDYNRKSQVSNCPVFWKDVNSMLPFVEGELEFMLRLPAPREGLRLL